MSLLTLDQTTLFYWNLSNTYLKDAHTGARDITTWTQEVQQDVKTHKRKSTATPSMTTGRSRSSQSTASRPPPSVASRTSALSNGIKISGRDDKPFAENGAISDRDETTGVEYEAKKASPAKGGVRVTSSVSAFTNSNASYSLLFDSIRSRLSPVPQRRNQLRAKSPTHPI